MHKRKAEARNKKVAKYSDAYWYINFLAPPVAIAAAVGITLAVRKVPFKRVFPVNTATAPAEYAIPAVAELSGGFTACIDCALLLL